MPGCSWTADSTTAADCWTRGQSPIEGKPCVRSRLDRDGARVGAPTELRANAQTPVLRYPRITALGAGWALSYWDGTGGPVLQRLDANASPVGAPITVRTGDERGGHTSAGLAFLHGDTLAVSWQVTGPTYGHGSPGEQPRRPGARLATLRCRR